MTRLKASASALGCRSQLGARHGRLREVIGDAELGRDVERLRRAHAEGDLAKVRDAFTMDVSLHGNRSLHSA